jgi:hypothetical protein
MTHKKPRSRGFLLFVCLDNLSYASDIVSHVNVRKKGVLSMHVADFLIHISETLEDAERASLETALRQSQGVIAPRFNKETPQLLCVSYDPEQVDAVSLLRCVTDRGYAAQLVGM